MLRNAVIVNGSDYTMSLTPSTPVAISNPVYTDVDLHAEVRTAAADQVTQVFERERSILPGVARDDVPASAANQFVNTEILKMPAIRDVDVLPFVVRQTK